MRWENSQTAANIGVMRYNLCVVVIYCYSYDSTFHPKLHDYKPKLLRKIEKPNLSNPWQKVVLVVATARSEFCWKITSNGGVCIYNGKPLVEECLYPWVLPSLPDQKRDNFEKSKGTRTCDKKWERSDSFFRANKLDSIWISVYLSGIHDSWYGKNAWYCIYICSTGKFYWWLSLLTR